MLAGAEALYLLATSAALGGRRCEAANRQAAESSQTLRDMQTWPGRQGELGVSSGETRVETNK